MAAEGREHRSGWRQAPTPQLHLHIHPAHLWLSHGPWRARGHECGGASVGVAGQPPPSKKKISLSSQHYRVNYAVCDAVTSVITHAASACWNLPGVNWSFSLPHKIIVQQSSLFIILLRVSLEMWRGAEPLWMSHRQGTNIQNLPDIFLVVLYDLMI